MRRLASRSAIHTRTVENRLACSRSARFAMHEAVQTGSPQFVRMRRNAQRSASAGSPRLSSLNRGGRDRHGMAAERRAVQSDPVPTTNFSESWTRVDQTSDPSFHASLLEATRAQVLDEARSDPDTVFGALGLRPGLWLLDVGCGTGDYLHVMAPLVAPATAIGTDLSTELIKRAEFLSLADQAHLLSGRRRLRPSVCRRVLRAGHGHPGDAPPGRSVKALTELRRVLVPGTSVDC